MLQIVPPVPEVWLLNVQVVILDFIYQEELAQIVMCLVNHAQVVVYVRVVLILSQNF